MCTHSYLGPRKQNSAGPMKPLSSYMCFAKAYRDKIVADHPGIQIGQIGKLLEEIWRGMSPEDKAPYYKLAQQDRERYQREVAERSEEGKE